MLKLLILAAAAGAAAASVKLATEKEKKAERKFTPVFHSEENPVLRDPYCFDQNAKEHGMEYFCI